jgi:hypothetical protein
MKSYVPAGTISEEEGSAHTELRMPLQTTVPTEVPNEVLDNLASTAGHISSRNGESYGLMSALISEDSTNERQRFEAGEEAVERDTTWPTGGKHKYVDSQTGPYENGMSNGVVSRSILVNFAGILNCRSGAIKSGSGPLACFFLFLFYSNP